ncbi:MAG: GGDEF domain-containing protein [Kiritimatiellales bacterium]
MNGRLQQRLIEIGAPADVCALAAELAELAVRDPLTGLYNRRFFDAALAQNIEIARRYDRPLSLVLFDINKLKQINDTQGHTAGDAVLKTFAGILKQTARKADIVCRIGGDEFAAILPETGKAAAGKFVDRFLAALNNESLSAAAGIAELPSENLLAAAAAGLIKG